MHQESIPDEDVDCNKNQHQKKLTYYLGSAFFAIGIAILAVGVGCIIYFNLHYKSLPIEILITTLFLGISIIMILLGINLMMRQSRYGHLIIAISTLMSFVSLLIFGLYYPDGWYYPLISYVLLSYILGFLLLIGNAFGNVILAIISNSTEPFIEKVLNKQEAKTYSDEEIDRDIEEAVKRSMEIAVSDLKFKDDDLKDIKLGKAFRKNPGVVTRVKDDIGEVMALKVAINPEEKEELGSKEIDDISSQLDKIMMQQTSEDGKINKAFKVKHKRFRLFS